MPQPRSSARYASFTVVFIPTGWQILRSLRLPSNELREQDPFVHESLLILGEPRSGDM